MILHVYSCARAVTATVIGTTVWETPLKAKEPRKSQRNKTRSWKQACRFANIMQTFWSTELARTGKEPKTDETYRAISRFVSPVLTNIKGFSYIPVIVSHIWDKFPISCNTPCIYMTTCDLDNSMIFCLSCKRKLPGVLPLDIWVAKRQQYPPTWSSLPGSLLLSMTVFHESYQWKGLKQLFKVSEACARDFALWHYHAYCSSWFWFWPQSQRESVEHLSAGVSSSRETAK